MAGKTIAAGGKKNIKLPTKRTLNFAESTKQKGINWFLAIPLIIVILILVGLFAKYAVIAPFNKLNKLRSENAALKRTNDEIYEKIASFEDAEEEYAHYTFSGFTEEEADRADRYDAVKLIDKYIRPSAKVTTWSLNGNTMVVSLTGADLEAANKVVANLEKDETVNFCTVKNATTSTVGTEEAIVKITIYLNALTAQEGGNK